jgi:Fur family ferric uptake transcriptional regulator
VHVKHPVKPSPLDKELREAIRSRGLRATPARIAVLRSLALAAAPLSHADLVAQLPPKTDRTTIFRALIALTDARLLLRIEVGDRVWRYSRALKVPDEGAVPSTFVCTICGAVEELAHVRLSTTTGPLALRRGAVRVLVHGRCDDCG